MTLSALKVQGPFRGVSGYDHHVREFVKALHRLGVAIELVDLPIWGSAELPADICVSPSLLLRPSLPTPAACCQ